MKIFCLILFVTALAPVWAADDAGMTPPMPPSPVGEFRRWLTNSTERKIALAKRSEKSRRVLEQKIEEYSAMPEVERNRRLEAMESMQVRSYIAPLMSTAPEHRDLTTVPVILRPIVEVRLEQWDKLRPDLRKEVLDHELMLQYFSAPAQRQAAVLRAIPEGDRKRIEQRVVYWSNLSQEERENIDERLGRFFRMAPEKQEKTLNNFSPRERQEMATTLQVFRTLAPAEREVCIQSFARFATMTSEEQLAFLKNVERWQAMPQKDREVWREIVKAVPPMPPLPELLPPLPTN